MNAMVHDFHVKDRPNESGVSIHATITDEKGVVYQGRFAVLPRKRIRAVNSSHALTLDQHSLREIAQRIANHLNSLEYKP